MQEKQIINVSQGVWLDERWLHKAGLGSRVQVELRTGEIRIHSSSETTEVAKPSKKGWGTFQTLSLWKTIMRHLFVDTRGWMH